MNWKGGAGPCLTYIRACESGKLFVGRGGKKKRFVSCAHISAILLGGQIHNNLYRGQVKNFVSHVKRLTEPLF